MATQVQFRRGTSAQNDSFTGAAGEISINTSIDTIRVHDGSTQGGFELARDNLENIKNVGVLTATVFRGDVNSSGVSTFANGNVLVGGATTTLVVAGDTRITGILTVGTSSITLNGTSTQVNVGSATTIHTGGYRIGSSDLHSTGLSISDLTVTNNATVGGGLTVTGVTNSSGGFSGNLTGNVTGTVSSISNHDTGDLAEGSNLYYTNARARSAISVTDSGGDGSLSYNSGTGAITYTGPSASEVRAHFSGGTGVSISSGQISIGQPVATNSNVTFNDIVISNNATVGGGLTVTGDLVVNGTTTTINSTTISVDDKNIELGATASPSDTSANGGGITLKGTTDHTISWSNTNDSWDFSEHVNIVTGKEYRIADTSVLSATTLGSGVVNSSLTSVGTIASGTWQATPIANAYLANSTISGVSLGSNLNTLTMGVSGTGLSGSQTYNGSGAATFTVTSNATSANTGSTIVSRDASGNFSAGTITASLSGNSSTATKLATARTIALSGDVTGSASFDGSANATISATIAANSVALGTDTTGNYVASITNGSYITGGNGGSEGAGLTLAVDATSANTASKVVARDASGNFSAGTITASLSGTATTTTNIPNLSGDVTSANTVTTLATVNSNVGTFGNGSSIPTITVNAKGLVTAVSTTAVDPANDGTLTLATSGTGLSGSATFTANDSDNVTFTVTSNATSANTGSTIVSRDASGNFSAGTITASLSGNATSATTATTAGSCSGNSATATKLATARSIGLGGDVSGSANFDGSANITITATVANDSHTHDGRYYTESESDTRFLQRGVNSWHTSSDGRQRLYFSNLSHTYLKSSDNIYFRTENSDTDNCYVASGSITCVNVNSTSDINLKKDIEVISNANDILNQINGVRFTWKSNDEKCVGVIAQEVEKVLPELVIESETEEKTKTVNYQGLIGVLIEAVKDQQKQIETLNGRIKSLEENLTNK